MSPPIALIEFLDPTSSPGINADLTCAENLLKTKHELFVRRPSTVPELVQALNDWPEGNRQFLYLASHGNTNGIYRSTPQSDHVTWPDLVKNFPTVDAILLASCFSESGAVILYSRRTARLFVMGTTDYIKPSELKILVEEFLDSLYDSGSKKFNFDTFWTHADRLIQKVPKFRIYPSDGPK